MKRDADAYSVLGQTGASVVSPATRCSSCGAVFDTRAWRALELVERIESERVREFVTRWPDDVTIEARQCACGVVIARRGEALSANGNLRVCLGARPRSAIRPIGGA
ncbi:MAG: hypothetical protein WBY94_15990 [Polyangiaceae bacterium]